jgi:hypothetical protein
LTALSEALEPSTAIRYFISILQNEDLILGFQCKNALM